MKRKQTPTTNNQNMNAKSDFVFLEDDDDQKIAVHFGYARYDCSIISSTDFANLLYKNS